MPATTYTSMNRKAAERRLNVESGDLPLDELARRVSILLPDDENVQVIDDDETTNVRHESKAYTLGVCTTPAPFSEAKQHPTMKTITFTYRPRTGYHCSEPGDQDGEYVKAEVAAQLLTMLQKLVGTTRAANFAGTSLYKAPVVMEALALIAKVEDK